jgi:uncharacterized protein
MHATGLSLSNKESALRSWLLEAESVLVGFSGGVDSAFLACFAVETLGNKHVLAVIGRSASYPASQWETARHIAARFGVPVLEVETHETDDPRYTANPSNRCYFCKGELWRLLTPIAAARGLARVIDGSNADDVTDYRPGARAAAEAGVASPLAACGLNKSDIRALAARRGLPNWNAPASPCLSSRIPNGIAVTPDRLLRVERAEAALRHLGVAGNLRVRYHGDLARVELPESDVDAWLEPARAARLAAAVQDAGFARVAIDLRGFRSGSLNVLSGIVVADADLRVDG